MNGGRWHLYGFNQNKVMPWSSSERVTSTACRGSPAQTENLSRRYLLEFGHLDTSLAPYAGDCSRPCKRAARIIVCRRREHLSSWKMLAPRSYSCFSKWREGWLTGDRRRGIKYRRTGMLSILSYFHVPRLWFSSKTESWWSRCNRSPRPSSIAHSAQPRSSPRRDHPRET